MLIHFKIYISITCKYEFEKLINGYLSSKSITTFLNLNLIIHIYIDYKLVSSIEIYIIWIETYEFLITV